MAAATRGIFIVAAKRTPFGTFGGKIKDVSATELAKVACIGALKAGNVPADAVDSVIIGNVIQVSSSAVDYYRSWYALDTDRAQLANNTVEITWP